MRVPRTSLARSATHLSAFFLLSWLHMLWLARAYLMAGLPASGLDLATLFHVCAWIFYSFLYLVPSLLLTALAARVASGGRHLLPSLVALVSTTASLLLVRADSMVYDLYAFHVNSFVLNLVVTPGGIASLGSGRESQLSFGLMIAGIVALQSALFFASLRKIRLRLPRYFAQSLTAMLCCVFLVQSVVYGISDLNNDGPVLEGAKAFPLFQRVRFRGIARHLGYEHRHRSEFAATRGSSLRYPLHEVPFVDPGVRPNIIMLVAESLRWDQLNPETMPNTWRFSQQARRFENHYSSGNGTREGLFGMFYGLYGSYWESFMTAQRAPLLMERLRGLGYVFDLRTSATFTYPEFDKTLFAGFSAAALHAADAGLAAWDRDELNTDQLLDFIEQAPADKPFFEFLFFESTHAPYSFPAAEALDGNYGHELDYASLSRASLAANIGPVFARYRNAAHWVDAQLGRIYQALEHNGLLDNTIVIVTGDHGEEFMEEGAWGHNSSFVEEQTHVPFVLSMPNGQHGSIDRASSHLDVATTLLQTLGANGATSDYTLGTSLLAPAPREHLVLSDWHSIGVLTPELKYRIPYLNLSGADYWAPTDATDMPLAEADAEALIARYRDLILDTMANCTRFSQRGGVESGTHALALE